MPGYDPQRDGPYGEWLRSKNVGYNPHGRIRTERVVAEGTLTDGQHAGERYQVRQDELGNRVRERSAQLGVSTGQDVRINAPCITTDLGSREVRDGVA